MATDYEQFSFLNSSSMKLRSEKSYPSNGRTSTHCALHLPQRDVVVCNPGDEVFAAAGGDDSVALLRISTKRESDFICVYLVLQGIVFENVVALPTPTQGRQKHLLVFHVVDGRHHHLSILRQSGNERAQQPLHELDARRFRCFAKHSIQILHREHIQEGVAFLRRFVIVSSARISPLFDGKMDCMCDAIAIVESWGRRDDERQQSPNTEKGEREGR